MTPQPDVAVDHLFLAFQQVLAGRYSLERELGRGGMGVVYLAREVRLDRPVAIKLLPPELAVNADLRERFIREARTAARCPPTKSFACCEKSHGRSRTRMRRESCTAT